MHGKLRLIIDALWQDRREAIICTLHLSLHKLRALLVLSWAIQLYGVKLHFKLRALVLGKMVMLVAAGDRWCGDCLVADQTWLRAKSIDWVHSVLIVNLDYTVRVTNRPQYWQFVPWLESIGALIMSLPLLKLVLLSYEITRLCRGQDVKLLYRVIILQREETFDTRRLLISL